MCMAPRHDAWFAQLIKIPGKDVPKERLGTHMAGLAVKERRDGATIVVDMGGGYGGGLYEHLNSNNIDVYPYRGSAGTTKRRSRRVCGRTRKSAGTRPSSTISVKITQVPKGSKA